MNIQELLEMKQRTPAPLVYCLCGSTDKAIEAFKSETLRLTLLGCVVLSIGANAKDSDLQITPDVKTLLDVLHLYKIDMSHVVRILNVDHYIGESTKREEQYAHMRVRQGKLLRVEYLLQ